MKNKLFAIGDIHGQISMLKELLAHWDEESQQLLFLGDLGDRGEDSKAVFELVYQLVSAGRAICLKGNHEVMLERFLKNPEEKMEHFQSNGGTETILSFLPHENPSKLPPGEVAELMTKNNPWLLPFLESLPLYKEWHDFVFVHAGVDLSLKDWKDSNEREFVWIREEFYEHSNKTGKTFVFGHTPTPILHGDNQNNELWRKNNMIGLDGGAVYGGMLHGIICTKDGVEQEFSIKNTGYKW